MNREDDQYLDVLQNIEFGLKELYEENGNLTDKKVALALDNAKIAIKKQFGYAQNEKVDNEPEIQGIIRWCNSIGLERINKVNKLTLKEYVRLLDKVRRSVILHSEYGVRGYYEFIRNFIE